jgi:hypothetical protein
MSGTPAGDAWPSLPLAPWQETLGALHLRTQIVGKPRLALAPMENHWWQVALYVTARGLSTSAMPVGSRLLEVELDLRDHLLVMRTSDGGRRELPLRAEPVAAFYAAYREALAELGVGVALWPVPRGDERRCRSRSCARSRPTMPAPCTAAGRCSPRSTASSSSSAAASSASRAHRTP